MAEASCENEQIVVGRAGGLVLQAIEAPENFLQILVTKSAAFQKFRSSFAGSAVALALIDAFSKQLSLAWLRQKFQDVTNQTQVLFKLLKIVLCMCRLRQKKVEMTRIKATMLASSQGSWVTAVYLWANGTYPEHMRNAHAKQLKRIEFETDKSSRKNSFLQRMKQVNKFKDENVFFVGENQGGRWIRQWCKNPITEETWEASFPCTFSIPWESLIVNVSLAPLPRAADFNGGRLISPSGKLDEYRTSHSLQKLIESDVHPNCLDLEVSSVVPMSERKSAGESLVRFLDHVKSEAGKFSRGQDPVKIVVTQHKGACSYSDTRWIPNLNHALVPEDVEIVRRDMRFFFSETPRIQNYTFVLLGNPGTGKTSTVLQLAADFNLEVHVTSLSNFCDKQGSWEGLVLIEEFETQIEDLISEKADKSKLSKFYNLLDGSAQVQGSVIVLTANSVSDDLMRRYPAMFRKGRIDRFVRFPEKVSDENRIKALELAFAPVSVELYVGALNHLSDFRDFSIADFSVFIQSTLRVWKRKTPEDSVKSLIQSVLDDLERERVSRSVEWKESAPVEAQVKPPSEDVENIFK